jgi:glycosyltransferase involved in cell wall biosynthesis
LSKIIIMIKHSVILLTYNQENIVKRALDSIFTQSILPYEVLIGDDASFDGTFQIIKQYEARYPNIVKAYQHSQNMGIFANQNFLMEKVSGDIVSFLGGDDCFRPNLFFELNNLALENNVDLRSKFVLVTNSVTLDLEGKETVFDNYSHRNKNPFKRRLRYSLNYRSVGISSTLLTFVGPILEDVGFHADWLWCLKIDFNSEKHIYTNFISSEYHSGIGVISKISHKELNTSFNRVLQIVKKEFDNHLNKQDKLYLNLVYRYEMYKASRKISDYLNFLYLYIRNINNIDKNNYIRNYKNLIPIPILLKLISLKSFMKRL